MFESIQDIQNKNIINMSELTISSELLSNKFITDKEKILFGFIKVLSLETLGCIATNKYLGFLCGCSKQNISNSIASLKKHNYIIIKHTIENNQKIRHIYSFDDFNIPKNIKIEKQIISNKKKRKRISKTLRFEILKRDNFKCTYCGAEPKEKKLEIDHIVPFSKDGECNKDNYTTACFDCNRGKGNKTIDKNQILKREK